VLFSVAWHQGARANVRNFFFANLAHIEDENSEQTTAGKSDRRFLPNHQRPHTIFRLPFCDRNPRFQPTMIILSLPAFFKKSIVFVPKNRPFQDL